MASLLIADDEKNILSGLRLAFEDEGYTVITASDGKEAWEKDTSTEKHQRTLLIFNPRSNSFTQRPSTDR